MPGFLWPKTAGVATPGNVVRVHDLEVVNPGLQGGLGPWPGIRGSLQHGEQISPLQQISQIPGGQLLGICPEPQLPAVGPR